MNIKELKPKAKESTFILSLDGKAVFAFGNINCLRLVKTDIYYNGHAAELVDWKKRYSGLEFVECDCILENEKCDQWDFNGYKINGYARQIDFLTCFQEDIQIIPKDLIPVIKDIGMNCSTDVRRFFLNGIFFSENGDIVGCDAVRLSLKTSPITWHNDIIYPQAFDSFNGKKDVIVKYGSVERESAGIKEQFRYVWFSDGDNTVVTQVIKGSYPNYKKVIPDINIMEKKFVTGFSVFKKQEKVWKSYNNKVFINGENIIKPQDENSPELCFGKLKDFNAKACFNGIMLRDIYKQYGDKTYVYIPEELNHSFVFGTEDYFSVVMPMIA